ARPDRRQRRRAGLDAGGQLMRYEELYVAGTGTWFPPAVDAAEAVTRGWYDPGAAERHDYRSVTVADEPGADLAVRAIRTAVARSGHSPDEIALLLYATANYQGIDAWNVASYVQRGALTSRAFAVELRQLSNGGMAGFELAAGYLLADPSRRAAVLATGDRFALPGFDRWRADSGVVWGDAGTAVVVSRKPGPARVLSVASVSEPELEEMFRGDARFHPSPAPEEMPVDLERRQREFFARADAAQIRSRLADGLGEAAYQALADADTTVDELAQVVIPTLGRQLLERHYLRPLKLDLSRTTWEFARTVGHLGAGDQFAGLDWLLTTGQLRPGDLLLLVGLGAGYVWTCAVLEMCAPPGWAQP
ncbi:MAG: ketoacyl-ACP synthase III family protein, partial [Micromonosporaceae bacterium]